MSLISKQAGFSRVTTHKYLKNKDDAFRKCILQILIDSRAACEPILQKNREGFGGWETIESILNQWITPTFEGASNRLILQELKYFAQQIAEDLFEDAHSTLEGMLEDVIDRAEQSGEMSLEALKISSRSLANLIVSGVSGVKARAEIKDIHKSTHDIIQVFRLATSTTP